MRYKVGDKVRVRTDIRSGFASDRCTFVDDMEMYRGMTVTIDYIIDESKRYHIKEDENCWYWVDDFFEEITKVFYEGRVVLLRNGQIRLVHSNALYLPNGTFIEVENYNGRKHHFDDNFDIVEVHRQTTGNYKFDLSGELIQEDN